LISGKNTTKGTVSEIWIERDENQFRNFNLTIGITVDTENKLTYNQGEHLLKQYRKNLLGKNIELKPVAIPCPVCDKTFNSEQGAKRHMRMSHSDEEIRTKTKKNQNPEKQK
jgi:hypothetical protein